VKILILNAGSSSYKLAIFDFKQPNFSENEPFKAIWEGSLSWNGHKAKLSSRTGKQPPSDESIDNVDHRQALKHLLTIAQKSKAIDSLSEISIVGHRIVHGGSAFQEPTWITPTVKKTIASLIPLAPLHNPINLEGIEICESMMPKARQAAVFDTAFHATISEPASTYPGPFEWKEQQIKRYGFHGINHEYCAQRTSFILKRDLSELKIISCHLGNGASLAAIAKGKSIDTTMGFTPIEGLMMGSRCGSIDPGIQLFLQQQKKLTTDKLFHILNYDSGLKGISGISGDMRDILRLISEGDVKAKLAYQIYLHYLKRHIGAMAGVLEGFDALVFTAGIGENVPQLRKEVCLSLNWLGLLLDEEKNESITSDAIISSKHSKIHVLVLKAQEDWSIANACWNLASIS